MAKIELGKRISEIPKATNNNPTDNNQYSGQIDSPVDSTLKQKPKSETIAELGLTQKQAERFQQMAKNPDAVHAAMTKAREAGDVVSQAQILSEIKQTQKELRQEERRERKAYTPPIFATVRLTLTRGLSARTLQPAKAAYRVSIGGLADFCGTAPPVKNLQKRFANTFPTNLKGCLKWTQGCLKWTPFA